MNINPYEAFSLYIALKNHFTQKKYDFFRYGGKTTVTKESFEARRDRFQFQKLSRLHSADEMRDFIVSNLIKNVEWVGDLLENDAEENYNDYLRRKQSLGYIFTNEVDKAFEYVGNPANLFKKPTKGAYPIIIELYLQGVMSLETFTILEKFISFDAKFDNMLGEDDIIWSKLKLLSKKFHPFMEYDPERMKSILKNKVEEYAKYT